jgi:two-component system sensor histidine kinase KdpD
MPMGATFALVWLATVSLVVINYFVPINLVSLIYMLPVVVAATQWGVGPGIVAAVAGAAAADFFFYPPLYTLWIRDQQNASRCGAAKRKSESFTPSRKASPPVSPAAT